MGGRAVWWEGARVPVVVACLIYSASLVGQFTFDDRAAVQGNSDVTNPEKPWAALWRNDFWGSPAHLSTSNKSYRPLTIALFRAVRALTTPAGRAVQPWPYRLLNVGLHAGAHPARAQPTPCAPHAAAAAVTAQVHALALFLGALEAQPDVQVFASVTGAHASAARARRQRLTRTQRCYSRCTRCTARPSAGPLVRRSC
jgi:hypothetical protein